MPVYEFDISRVQRRTVFIPADSLVEAQRKAEDAFRTIHINNQDPWKYEDVRTELVDVTTQ